MAGARKAIRTLRRNIAAWVVLAVALAFTTMGVAFERKAHGELERHLFEEEVAETIGRLQRRLDTLGASLNGARGLAALEPELSRARFHSYIAELEIGRLYPGIQGIAWVEALTPADVKQNVDRAKADGLGEYAIWPEGERDTYAAVTYIEPLDWRNRRALGFDLLSSSVRREALDRARDTGLPAATGKLLLAQETEGDEQSGFIIFAAIYDGEPSSVDERRRTLRGWVAAVFRIEDLMAATYYLPSHRKLEVEVFDGKPTPDALFFDNDELYAPFDEGEGVAKLHRFVTVPVAGREWTVHLRARPELLGATHPLWLPLLVGGTSLSFFLFFTTRKLIASRDSAETAEQRARFLAEAGTRLSASLDYATTLAEVARLSVPFLADFSAFDLLDEEGHIRPTGLAHRDPSKVESLRALRERLPPDPNAPIGIAKALRSSETQLLARIADDFARGQAGYLDLLRSSHPRSYMCAPVKVRGESIGTLTFISLDADRHYNQSDVAVVEELARLVATAVDNARLYRRTDEASRMKDEFLATLSHELRTPLNAILGWARMLRVPTLAEPQRAKAVETIERNAHLQTQLIADLLDVSRIITGKLRLDARPIDLARVVESAIDTIRAAADAKRITIEPRFDPESGPVLADPSRMQQVAWNFLANAVKFSAEGSRIEVRVERRGEEVLMTFADTGQGINPAFLPYVFERFRQADSSTTRVHGGLGLGLAIVRHLVELHGGRVSAESAGEGKGATFTVRLPRLQGVSIPALTTQRDLKTLPQLVGVKVVVVDDEPDVRELLLAVLTQSGADAIAVASAAEAIETIQTAKADVLVSDIAMPHEDGYSLMRRVRALPTSVRDIPALALTAYAREEDVERSLAAGFQKHLSKPVNPVELLEVIASLLPPDFRNRQAG